MTTPKDEKRGSETNTKKGVKEGNPTLQKVIDVIDILVKIYAIVALILIMDLYSFYPKEILGILLAIVVLFFLERRKREKGSTFQKTTAAMNSSLTIIAYLVLIGIIGLVLFALILAIAFSRG